MTTLSDKARQYADRMIGSEFDDTVDLLRSLADENDQLRNAGWASGFNPPYDVFVEVKLSTGLIMVARLRDGTSMDEELNTCDQWEARDGEDYPRSWSGGACWSSNEEESPSTPVVGWRYIKRNKMTSTTVDGVKTGLVIGDGQ